MIGEFWLGHHRKFRYIVRYDSTLLFLNLLLLMSVAFIPFPTAVLSAHSNRTGTIFYALMMLMAGLVNASVWIYAAHNSRLIEPPLTPSEKQRQTTRALVMPGVFLFSIGLAFISPDLAKYSWLLIAVLLRFV